MSETVTCCPECGNSSLFHRPGGGGVKREHDPTWRCKHCKSTFETPAEREPKNRAKTGHEKLAQAGFAGLVGGESDE